MKKRAIDFKLPKAPKKPTEMTEAEAVAAFNFKDAQDLDKFALQLDAMALMMYEKKIESRPVMVEYIDTHFLRGKEKILAGIFVGQKITENQWVRATMGVQ